MRRTLIAFAFALAAWAFSHPFTAYAQTTGGQAESKGEAGAKKPDTGGWRASGSHPQDYEMGTDAQVRRSGKASGFIKSKPSQQAGFGTWMQNIKADDYRGKRLRLSGFVKVEKVEESAHLWMRVDGAQGELLSFDNMDNRPISGTTNWKRHDIVLDVPANAFMIAFGLLLAGKGQAWFDDLTLEEVGQDVASTDVYASRPVNLDFESPSSSGQGQRPVGWGKAGSHPQDYETGVDNKVRRSGHASGFVRSKSTQPGGFATLMTGYKASDHVGKRLRLSGFIKGEQVEKQAALWMRVDGAQGKTLSFDNMNDRPIKGTSDWKRYDIVLDVPTGSADIAFGVLLEGKGQVWVDDLRLEEVGQDVASTNLPLEKATTSEERKEQEEWERKQTEYLKELPEKLKRLPSKPVNLNFEEQ
jgi:hypothetical protein